MAHITCTLVPESERLAVVDKLFGIQYVLLLEPAVFRFAETLAHRYSGGAWAFYEGSSGFFYMAPRLDTKFEVSCENGYVGKLSADALGIVSCLYAFSALSFGDGTFAEICAGQYHLLREYVFQHAEAKAILRAID